MRQTILILISLYLTACSLGVWDLDDAPKPVLAKIDRGEVYPVEDSLVDVHTARVIGRLGHDTRLTLLLTSKICSWRNGYGAPFIPWVYEGDCSTKSLYLYTLRYNIGYLLQDRKIVEAFRQTIRDIHGVDWKPSKYWAEENNDDPHVIEIVGPADGYFWPGWWEQYGGGEHRFDWYRKHIGENASRDDRRVIANAFAWYTSPNYEQGSLPQPIEEVLSLMMTVDYFVRLEKAERLGEGHGAILMTLLREIRNVENGLMKTPRRSLAGAPVHQFFRMTNYDYWGDDKYYFQTD